MRFVRRAGFWLLLAPLLALLLMQAYFFLQIGWWVNHNPESTSFMQRRLQQLQQQDPAATLRYQWVPYQRISRHLKRAIIAAEDASFSEHQGIDWQALEKAYEKNQKRGKVVAGGSTITQQLAKNLFLSGERNFVRKGQELVLSFALEAVLGKRRILEIYLNSVEWGEGVFGADAAAHRYFGAGASQLGAQQAAQLAVMLPAPKRFEKRPASPYVLARAATIVARMGHVELP